ncbi:hypothetical protein [Methylobacterium fujisawaense]|uniref:hypothetical protein n=1 Tax=Methylobacterium fujisawaense TaxID=107400 RepID=UPI002449D80D|nr:hypothetical protein [Methylobacterium fujisawaense]MDH3031071.1 hypothetical protein [Methylobacterium fujisawaense]
MKSFGVSVISISVILTTGVMAQDIKPNVAWCNNETGSPTNIADTLVKMPDGHLRGTRPPATLAAEARNAKARGNCDEAVEWLIHCQEHNENVKNSFRVNKQAVCDAL